MIYNENANKMETRTMVIASRGGKVCRTSFNPRKAGIAPAMFVSDTEFSSELASMQMAVYTIAQLNQMDFDGVVEIYTNDDIAVRSYEYAKALKNGVEPLDAMCKAWMDGDYLEQVEQFCTVAQEFKGTIHFTPIRNAYVWDIVNAAELKAAGVVIPEGTEVEFINGVATFTDAKTGEKVCEIRSRLNLGGENSRSKAVYKVVKYGGEYALARPNKSVDMLNVLNAISATWARCPKPEIDFSNVEANDGSL